MATATLTYDLSDPDDAREHRYALAGRDALIALDRIEEAIRARLKYAEPSDAERRHLEEMRGLIPHELLELLE